MPRPSTRPPGGGTPEPLTLLHQRLLQAEEEAEALIRDAGALGAPGGRMVGSAPAGPLKEHRAPGREAAELRDRLQRACRERDEARREVARLGERLQEAAVAKEDVALAADELKIVKLEMSQKLAKMRRQLEEEAKRRRALRTRLVEQLHNQEFLLVATRRSVHADLQVALRDKANLQLELEKLTEEHSRLLQSSAQTEPERTTERPRGSTRKRLQGSRAQVSELEAAGETVQQEPEDSAGLQARREIGKHRAEVEKLQRLLMSTHSKSSRALESLQKASDAARVDNKRLTQSLERHLAAATLRDEELREARTEIGRLSEELGAARRRRRETSEVSPKQEAVLERWTSTIQRWEAKRALGGQASAGRIRAGEDSADNTVAPITSSKVTQ